MRYDETRSDSDEELISSSSKSRKIEEDNHQPDKKEPLQAEVKIAANESQNPAHTRRKPKRHGKRTARVE